MQNGRIYRKGKSWILDYWSKVQEPDGKTRWAKRSKKIAPFCDKYRSEASVRHLAQDILAPHNARTARPESTDTVTHFIEHVYLPHCKASLKPSTHFGYKFLFKMVKPHLGTVPIRNFGPVEGERLLADFAAEKPRANTVLKNMKGFLSGAFRYAVRTGVIRFNPMRETMLPRNGKPMESGRAYTLEEIQAMLKILPEPARTAVLVAALTGLRRSEIRGLRWDDFTGDELHVQRSVWASHVGATKTSASNAPVPVLPVLRDALEAHRKRTVGPFIFSGGTGKPLVLANVTRRDIVPTLVKAKINWEGWHGFRRGLASNLNRLGVDDSVIQRILRHSSVHVTQAHYIKVSSVEAQDAMKQLGREFDLTGSKQ